MSSTRCWDALKIFRVRPLEVWPRVYCRLSFKYCLILSDISNSLYYFIKGFWLKTASYREYPEIHFKNELLMVAELEGEGSYVTYSTFQAYNILQQDHIRIPIVTVSRKTYPAELSK